MKDLKLDSVTFAYRKQEPCIRDITFTLEHGKCLGIIGPNGAGKTTLLKIIAGLYKAQKGTVKIRTGASIGMLFQDPDDQIIMPTVKEDIAFGPENLSVTGEDLERAVEQAARQAGVTALLDRQPHHLSFGEKKKVALAGVLAMEPDILLLDEPTANLDPKSRRELIDIIKRDGRTKVIATHDLELVSELAHRVLVMNKKKMALGTTRKILTDLDLLKRANLEPIPITRLFVKLTETGIKDIDRTSIPITTEEAYELLKKIC